VLACVLPFYQLTGHIAVEEDMDYVGDRDGNLKRPKSKRPFHSTLLHVFIGYSPSRTLSNHCWGYIPIFVKSFSAVKETVLCPGGPRYGRPSDRFGPPVALFDNALAIFQYDLGHLEAFTPLPINIYHAFDFVTTSTAFFESEEHRDSRLRDTVKALLPGTNKWQEPMPDGTTKPEGLVRRAFCVFDF
jgi:hypothetical protein